MRCIQLLLLILFALLFCVACIPTQSKPEFPPADTVVPILLYHDFIQTAEQVKPGYEAYSCTRAQFEEHLRTLARDGFTFISLETLQRAMEGELLLPKNPIVITFDDGYQSQYDIAYPLLKRYRICADLFVVTDWVGKMTVDNSCFSWREARRMEQSGLVTVYSHSTRHIAYGQEDPETLLADIQQSFTVLDKNLRSVHPRFFAYPYGSQTREQVMLLQQNGIELQLYDVGTQSAGQFDAAFLRRINVSLNMGAADILAQITAQ